MRFSVAVNVLLLGVATVVSALPIAQSADSFELEGRDDFDVTDMFERDFDEPASVDMYRRTNYHVALHKSDVGNEHEHWAIHIHPQNQVKSAQWHVVDAKSSKDEGHGKLVTDHEVKSGYDPARQGGANKHMILGSFSNAKDAHAAAESLKGIHCTENFPGENCVDWTKKAVQRLHDNGHVDTAHRDAFNAHYDTHAADVRKNTSTPANKKAAGIKR